jgi:transcriptional regulator with AAA-type ATPase domain/tetratricopeptide (TPR) repeat protein
MDALVELIGESPAVEALRKQILRLARNPGSHRPPNVLIQGETGTGKGLVASLLHRLGPRAQSPFVDVNCAAIPDTLLEAELFGYEQGAFTDARRAKPGLFQTAHQGTIFLDEVALLPLALQAKLLKVLEERSVRRLGGVKSEPVDAWVISATNADLPETIRDRQLRADLYHRLAVVTLELPPLRERNGDVVLLAEHFLARACRDYGLPRKTLATEGRRRLLAHGWPGNIRELANAIERSALLSEGSQVVPVLLGPAEAIPDVPQKPRRLPARRTEHHPDQAAPASPAATEFPGPTASPGHVPAAFTEEAMSGQSPGPIRWERRRMTLLRARLIGAEPDEALASSGRWLEILIEKVRTFGGSIQELGPEGLVAAFGLTPVEDAARRAAHAAMTIQRASERITGDRSPGPGVTLAIHTSQVMVGHVGGGAHVAHDDKQLAAAVLEDLMAAAAPGAILVSAATVPFLERRLELIEVGNAPARMYRLASHEGTGLGLWGSMGRFVGRHHELQMLRLLAASALAGHGQVAALVGEPGVGKSRLAWEFTRAEVNRGWLLVETGAMSYAAATPYLPAIQLLRSLLGIEPHDDPARVAEKVASALAPHEAAPEHTRSALLALLDVRVDDPRWHNLDPPQRRQKTLDAVRWLLIQQSLLRPVLLVLEDAHWIDAESQALFDSLVEGLPTARMLLIVTYRPEYRHGWASMSFYTQLSVDALSHESAEELLHGLLGAHPTLLPLTPRLVQWTDRNPFFLEESVRTLVDTGALEGERGAYRLVRPVPSIQVPATVQDVLATRIERLPDETRRLLQSAAIVGKDVARSILAAIADLPDQALEQRLAQLRTAELLYQTSVAPEVEYRFKHTLTHEVAYGSMPEAARRALHARILAALETRYADRLADTVDRLAHHAVRGEVWDKAVTYLRQAGARAFVRSANRDAVACYERALEALAHLPETRAALEQAIDLRFDLRLAHFPLGELQASLRHLREAERLAAALGDQRRLGWASAYMGNHHWLTGHLPEARALGERAQAIAAAIDEFPLRVVTSYYLGLAYQASGDYPRAEASFISILESLQGDLARERFGLAGFPVVICRCWLAWCLAERGQFEEAVAHGREAIRLAEGFEHRFSLAWAAWGLAHVALIRGDAAQAAPLLERSRTLSVEAGHLVWPHLHAWGFGQLRALSGQPAKAVALLQESLGAFDARGLGVWQSLVLVRLGEACLLAGRPAEARAAGERGLALARERTERSHEAWALRLLADIDARAEAVDLGAVEGRYREALTLARELGMRPLVAHCHLGLAALHRRSGTREQADEHLALARALCDEMGMPGAPWGADAPGPGGA